MSQIRRCSVKIKVANEDIVKATMEALAKHFGAQLVNQVQDASGRWFKVVTGIMKPGVGGIRGFGVTISGNTLTIIGDAWGQRLKIGTFKKLFENFYVATATTRALQSMGYQANANFEKGKIYVRGVKGFVGIV